MKKPFGKIASFGLLFFGMSTMAWANCGDFNQLVSQSQAIQAPFGDLDHPDCSKRPDESIIDGLISCFERLSTEPARVRSQADLQLASLYGVITQCYRSGLDQQESGKKAFYDLKAATQADPTYETAWIRFAETIAGMKQEGFFQQQAIQMALGISIDQELQAAIKGLSALPKDAAVSEELAKLRSLQ